jgi:heme-degrading monooxygenase HmoA
MHARRVLASGAESRAGAPIMDRGRAMFVAMRAFKAQPGAADEVRRQIYADLVPLLGQIPGYATHHLMDTPDDTIVLVSVFADQASADEASRQADEWARQHLEGMLQDPPTTPSGPDGAPGTT